MRLLIAVATAVLSLACNQASGFELTRAPKAFTAEYQAQYKGQTIEAQRSLYKQGDVWVLETDLKNFFASIREKSLIEIDTNLKVKTQRYDYTRKIFGITKRESRVFDWLNRQILFSDGDDQGSYPLNGDTFDQASQQLYIQDMLARGVDTFELKIASRNRLKDYIYQASGPETLKLPIGTVEAIRVSELDDDTRITTMWFAPAYDYQLVKLQQTEKDGKTYSLAMKDYKTL